MKKILLFKVAAIGDVLLTTPLIRQVRAAFPKAQIDYLVGKHSAAVVKDNPHLSNVHVFDDAVFFKKRVGAWMRLVRRMRKENYDMAFVLDKHWSFALTAKLMGIPVRYGFNRMGREGRFLTKSAPFGGIRHDVHYYLDLLKLAGGEPDYKDEGMELAIPEEEEEFAERFWKENGLGDDVVGVSIGGGSNPGQTLDAKIYPIERFIEVIQQIRLPVVLVGGPGDVPKAKAILAKCPDVLSLVGKTSIPGSAAIMKRCATVVCSDGGPMHMAASVNPDIVAIFGPTHPKRKGPLSKTSCVIWEDESVYDADAETYGLFPDYTYFKGVTTEEILSCISRYAKSFKQGRPGKPHGDSTSSQETAD